MTRSLPFIPLEELDGRPHVLVDGAPTAGTVLTLSHWPGTPTPSFLEGDLSTELVLDALGPRSASRLADRLARAEAVSADHFDEDGAMAVLAASAPDEATRRSALLVEVARCGDFGVVRSRTAAQVALALAPLATELVGGRADATAGERYRELIARLPELLDHPERYRRLFAEGDATLARGASLLQRGEIVVEEHRALDVAVVRAPGLAEGASVHPFVLHSATTATRLLVLAGGQAWLELRYEGWVRLTTRRVAARPALRPLAERLTALEPGRVTWEADDPDATRPVLRPSRGGQSDIAPDILAREVLHYLREAPPAWSPSRAAAGAQWTGSPQRGNQRSRSGSIMRSLASSAFSRSSASLSRRSSPRGTKG